MLYFGRLFWLLLLLVGTPGKECGTCSGKKVVRERKTFEVKVKAGTMPDTKCVLPSLLRLILVIHYLSSVSHLLMFKWDRLVLRGESNQLPGATPGDVVLIVNQNSHPKFRRQGNDLVYEHTLDLVRVSPLFFVSSFFVCRFRLLTSTLDDQIASVSLPRAKH